jgi:hypothetical protein
MAAAPITSAWGSAPWGSAPWSSRVSFGGSAIATGISLGTSLSGQGGQVPLSLGISLGISVTGLIASGLPVGIELGTSFGGNTSPIGPRIGVNLGTIISAVASHTQTFTVGIELGTGLTKAYGIVAPGIDLHVGFVPGVNAPQAIVPGVILGTFFSVSTSIASTSTIIVTITNGGSGYTAPPAVTLSNGGSGTAVLGNAASGTAGQVVGVTITNTGSTTGTAAITVAIAPPGGSGTTATAIVAPVNTTSATASQQSQPFQVRAEGYGALTIESLNVPRGTTPTSVSNLLQPPLRQPTQDASQSVAQSQSGQTQQTTFSKPWARWIVDLYNYLIGQSPASTTTLTFECPSVDETDSEWYATGTIDGSTDPATIGVTFVGQSRWGIQVTILAGGTGYTAPVITIAGADGTGWYATATAVIQGGAIVAISVTASGYGYTPPLSVQITDPTGTGALAMAAIGRQFNVGDYILWNDPTLSGGAYSYEIDQITAITPSSSTGATFTLARGVAGGTAGQAQFGSPLKPHGQSSPCAFYRLIDKVFSANPNNSAGTPQVIKFLWDNMTVCTVLATSTSFATSVLLNLAPSPYLPGTANLDLTKQPPQPGLRTMNGAAYTTLGITGALTAGMTSGARVSVQAHESIRTVYAKVQIAPTGPTAFMGDTNACIVIYVCYIAPPMTSGSAARVVGLIDTLVIDASTFTSYDDDNVVSPVLPNVPDGRQMPYHEYWPTNMGPNFDWPPNRLPVCTGALNSSGNLQLPITVDPTQTVLFAPDGQIDFIVSQVGTSIAGSNLIVTVQT